MRQTTVALMSPGEKIVKDIKRATRKQYSSEEKIKNGLRGEDSIASCVVVSAFLKAFITNGRRTSWKLANGGLPGTRHVLPRRTKSKTCAAKPAT